MLDNVVHPGEIGVKSVEHILTTIQDLKPAISFIEKHRPQPDSLDWDPTPNSKVFKFGKYWVVRQNRPEPEVRNKTEVYIRDDGKLLYVLWSGLDDNPNDAVQLTSMIAENPTDKKMVCIDGEKKITDSYTTLNYINTLLTYSF